MGARGSKEQLWMSELKGDIPIDDVVSRLEQFRAMNKLKQFAVMVVAENLSIEEIQRLKAMLEDMDKDGNCTITYDQLKAGLARLGSKVAEAEVERTMKLAGVDGNKTIDYKEFITATMRR